MGFLPRIKVFVCVGG